MVVLLATIVSLVSSKPIEEQLFRTDGPNNNSKYQLLRPRRELPDEITLNKQFFENIFKSSRISRDTSDGDAVPTIALYDLINSVEQTLIHSAQQFSLSNTTANLSKTNAEQSESNNNSNVEEIALPISVPTPAPRTEELATEPEDLESVTEEDLIRDQRSNDESGSGHKVTDFESVKPIEHSNLGILFPISLNPSANISHVVVAEEPNEDVPVTEPTNPVDLLNITILHTINATQVFPTQSDIFHVQQQQITFFSANAGVFPNIHAFNFADLPTISQAQQSSVTEEEDCSGEDTSDESADSSSEENSGSDSSSEENGNVKKSGCTVKTSTVASSKPTESTTPSVEAVEKLKTDELKEQIAEVEADPVILTQGI